MVLLVEDEDLVRALVRGFLERAGYRVVDADDGEAAIQAAEAHADTIQLVISDVRLPGMSGLRLADELRARIPDVKLLYMSGHPGESGDELDRLQAPGTAFLNKPFSRQVFLDTVSELLGARPA